MTWLVESPWPAVVLGAGVELLLAIMLLRSGRAAVLGAMIATACLTVLLVAVERFVETDAEAVEATLEQARASLEANDAQAVLALFTADSPRRAEVESILARVTVRAARIAGDMELEFDPPESSQSATASFTARVEARDNRGQIPYENMLGRMRVVLRRTSDGWRIHDYAQNDLRAPQAGRRR